MACVMDNNSSTINRIGIIPIASMRHMLFLPPFNGGLPSWSRLLNAVDGINGLVDISQHVVVGICVRVFLANVSVENPYLSNGKRLDDIIILHPSLRILN